MKTVTVIITTYNAEKTIRRALDSLVTQHGCNEQFLLEVIVVDDCSTDSTIEIAVQYPVKILSTGKNSGGPNRGRNLGLQQASGNYICLMDHDDEWFPHRVESQLRWTAEAPIVTCGYTIADKNGNENIRSASHPDGYRTFATNETFRDKLARRNDRQNCYLGTILFDSKLKNILFEEEYGQLDWDWILRLFHQNPTVEVCQSLYRRHVDGANLSLDRNYRLRDYQFAIRLLNQYQVDYPTETGLGRKRVNGTLARYFYLTGEMKEARKYFLKSACNLKTILFYLTPFAGHSYIRRKFHFFG